MAGMGQAAKELVTVHSLGAQRSEELLPGQQDRTLRNSREEAQNTHKTRRIVVQATYSVVIEVN